MTREEQWELYKDNIGHLLQEIRMQHVRDIVSMVTIEDWQVALDEAKKSNEKYVTLAQMIAIALKNKQ